MNEELKPCPFCGGRKCEVRRLSGTGLAWIKCLECDYVSASQMSAKKAIAAWNRRAESNRWIPVSERLPENYQAVLATYRSAGDRKSEVRVDVVGYSATYQTFEFGERGTSFDFDVLAWRPLPEPWREGE